MPIYEIEYEGKTYEVDYPNESPKGKSPQDSFGSFVANRLGAAAMGGVPVAAQTNRVMASEVADQLPLINQAVLGSVGGYGGSVGGATLGEAERQVFNKFVNGQKMNPAGIASTAAVSALTDGLARVGGNMVFAKPRAMNELKNGAGVLVGQMKNKLKETFPTVDSSDVLTTITDGLKNIADTSGKGGAILRRFQKIISQNPNMPIEQLIELRDRVGKATAFGKQGTEIQNKAVDSLLKKVGGQVQSKLIDLSKKAGISGWDKANSLVSNAAKAVEKNDPSVLGTLARSGLAGSIGFGLTQNPFWFAGAPAAMMALENPMLRNVMYKLIEQSGIGRGVTLGANAVANNLTRK